MSYIFVSEKRNFNILNMILKLSPSKIDSYVKNDAYFAFVSNIKGVQRARHIEIDIYPDATENTTAHMRMILNKYT